MCGKLSLRYPSSPETALQVALAEFPRVLPWHVTLVCGIVTDQSDTLPSGKRDFMMYLCQLLRKATTDAKLSMLNEVFVSDPVLVVMSLRVLLKDEHQNHAHHQVGSSMPR